VARRIAAVGGIRLEPGQELAPSAARLLAYAGLLSSHSRNKAGLENILSDYFDGIPVTVHEFVPQWRELPNPPKMGLDAQLGINAMAGSRIFDVSGKIRVSVGPLSHARFDTFLPGSVNISLMKECIQGYLADPLDFDIEIKLQAIDLIPVYLGESRARLGVTSSLGKSAQKSDINAIVIESK
jgi:type VI secretion system protein ImpH